MFNRPSTSQLVILTRSLGTSLHAGIAVVKAFEIAARKARPPLKEVLDDMIVQIKSGETVSAAFRSRGSFFPALMCDMIEVGEQSGALAEVLQALSDHYENNQRLLNEFIGLLVFPAVQLFAAIMVIAGVIWIMGWVSELNGTTIDILGFGLLGTSGALTWLGGWAILIVGLIVLYNVLAASLSGQAFVHKLLLRIPVVGHCLQAFAIARFSWGFHLTQEAGMPIEDSLTYSLKATSNGAFITACPRIIDDVTQGETLTDALHRTDLFPVEFIELVHVAETSGTVPEALHRLSPKFEEQARRAMRAMAVTFSWLTRLAVGLFIGFAIFRIFFWYISLINGAMQDMGI